jgi:hypothetical protein
MSSDAFKATVEIVKAALEPGGGCASNGNPHMITDAEYRDKFLEGIDALYKKLQELYVS